MGFRGQTNFGETHPITDLEILGHETGRFLQNWIGTHEIGMDDFSKNRYRQWPKHWNFVKELDELSMICELRLTESVFFQIFELKLTFSPVHIKIKSAQDFFSPLCMILISFWVSIFQIHWQLFWPIFELQKSRFISFRSYDTKNKRLCQKSVFISKTTVNKLTIGIHLSILITQFPTIQNRKSQQFWV